LFKLSQSPSLIGTILKESSGSFIIQEALETFEALFFIYLSLNKRKICKKN
jgi:hypothetical protein